MLDVHWYENFFLNNLSEFNSTIFYLPSSRHFARLIRPSCLFGQCLLNLYFVFKTNTLKIEKSCKKVLDLLQHKYLYYYISIWITYTKHKYVNSFNIIHYNWNYTHLTNRSCPVLQKACNRIPTKHKKVLQ